MREKLRGPAGRWGLRLPSLAGVAAAALVALAPASPAAAAVTIGQLAPGTGASTCSGSAFDRTQPTVTSGSPYVVPQMPPASALVIASWSHNAGPGAGQTMTMKVFRKASDPATYTAVGHDGPRPLVESTINTFPASVPVQPGDVLGVNNLSPAPNRCTFEVLGGSYLFRNGNLADGQQGAFDTSPDDRVNVSAVVAPSNAFSLGEVQRNKKKGTATLTVNNLPNPGELTASGNGVNAAGAAVISKAVTAGTATLLIKAKGKKKRKLNDNGKVKLYPAVTYTPTGGNPSTQSLKVKLKKKL